MSTPAWLEIYSEILTLRRGRNVFSLLISFDHYLGLMQYMEERMRSDPLNELGPIMNLERCEIDHVMFCGVACVPHPGVIK